MLRTAQLLPLTRAFDTALRRRTFPPDAGSLLPGPLAATRTGLAPAGNDELPTESDHVITQPLPNCVGDHQRQAITPLGATVSRRAVGPAWRIRCPSLDFSWGLAGSGGGGAGWLVGLFVVDGYGKSPDVAPVGGLS